MPPFAESGALFIPQTNGTLEKRAPAAAAAARLRACGCMHAATAAAAVGAEFLWFDGCDAGKLFGGFRRFGYFWTFGTVSVFLKFFGMFSDIFERSCQVGRL